MNEVLVYGSDKKYDSSYEEVHVTLSLPEIRKRVMIQDYLMIIIDLSGREKRGMELAEFIRRVPKHFLTPIVFLANNRSFEWAAFHSIHCYDYILKPLSMDESIRIMLLGLQRMSSLEKKERILFHVGSDLFPVNPDDILYLECDNGQLIVHTPSRNLNVGDTMNEFVEKHSNIFLRIHRGIAINKDKVKCINFANSVLELRETGEIFTIGRKYCQNVRKAFDEKYKN